MLLYYHSWMFYNHFIATLYHFLGLTYWPSAECQLLFLLVFYIAGNEYQTESKCHETLRRIFMDQKGHNGPWLRLGGAPREAQPTRARLGILARPGGCCPPRGTPQVQHWPTGCLLAQKKSSKSFVAFGLRFVLISCDVKNMQKTATGTGHYVNRLVPKNDIKWL